MSAVLLMKMTLVPTLIALVSLATQRWGSSVGGWLAGLPITGGPILYFLALEQGLPFATSAAQGALASFIPFCGFCLAFAWAGTRLAWWLALPLAYLTYVLMVLPTAWWHIPTLWAALAGAAMLLLSRGCYPANLPVRTRPVRTWEVPMRMAAALLLVLVVTGLAHWMGPRFSGISITFPVTAAVLGVFTQTSSGVAGVVSLYRGMAAGMLSFLLYMLVVASALPLGRGATFALAGVIALITHAVMLVVITMQRQGKVPSTAATGSGSAVT